MEQADQMHASILLDDTHRFLPENNSNKIQFNGLSKEEVMRYADDPKWVRLRLVMFILFWFVWFGMLATAALIVYFTPGCPKIPKQPWWEKELVYEIDVANFKDSNDDGLGDLEGLSSKLSYLKDDLGVGTILLSSQTSDKINSDKILAEFETNDYKLEDLRKSLKKVGMHFIVDIPFSAVQTSDGLNSVRNWLKLADGVRVNNVTKVAEFQLFKNYLGIVKEVEEKTFERKFFAVYPAEDAVFNETKPSSIFYKLVVNETEFQFNSIKSLYNNTNSNTWPNIKIDFTKSKISAKYLKIAHGITLLLRGTPFLIYGDEIYLKTEGNERRMKWDSSENCGFTKKNLNSITTCDVTVEEELAHGAGNTLIRMYKTLAKLRSEHSFLFGEIKFAETDIKDMGVFVSKADGFNCFIVAANFGESKQSFNFKNLFSKLDLPDKGKVVFFDWYDQRKNRDFNIDQEVSLIHAILLNPGEFVVISYFKKNN